MVQSNPLVSVIIPHHLNENDEYAKWCVKSVLASEGVDLEVIFVSDAPNWIIPADDSRLLVQHDFDQSLGNVTRKFKKGVELSKGGLIMLISDDVMVSKHTIAAMANDIGGDVIRGCASNCDSTTRYMAKYRLGDLPITLKMNMEDLKGQQQKIIDWPRMTSVLFPQPWLSFYCTMFPRKVLEDVGDFDESLDVRYNDVDFCSRAAKLGYLCVIHMGVFALHFGDKTLPKVTTPEMYAAADESYRNKYRVV